MQKLVSSLTLTLLLFTFPEVKAQEKVKSDSTYITQFADTSPEFPGGQDEMMRFIFSNLHYPAKSEKTEGLVIVGLTIDKEGKPRNAKILKSLSPETDNEALRIVCLFPIFTPGTKNGEIVAVSYPIPVRFLLPDSSSDKQKKDPKAKNKRWPGKTVSFSFKTSNPITQL